MTAIQIIAIVLMAFGSVVALLNWGTFISTRRSGRHTSPIPLAGAVLLGGGMLLLPATRPFAWAATCR